jgi:hypothetical protein
MTVSALQSSVWGDGFVRDAFTDVLGVRRWDCVSEDEFILYFPKLVERIVERSPRLIQRLTECVAVRAFRMRRRGAACGKLRSVSLEQIETSGRQGESSWFLDRPGLVGRLFRSGAEEAASVDREGLHLLDAVAWRARSGRPTAFDESSSAAFAFFSGIHPAYFSDSRLDWNSRELTAGWLGFLDRGRSAVMPLAVAEFLVDAVECAGRDQALPRDATIAWMVQRPSDWKKLKRVAELSLEGVDRIVRIARRPAVGTSSGGYGPQKAIYDEGCWA